MFVCGDSGTAHEAMLSLEMYQVTSFSELRMWLISLNLVTIFLFFAIPRAKQKLPCEVTAPRLSRETTEEPVSNASEAQAQAVLEEAKSLEASAKLIMAEATAAKAEAAKTLRDAEMKAARPVEKAGNSCSFLVDPCAVTASSAQAFDNIYARNVWGSRSKDLGTHTRSGLGSDMKGAFDWITQLSKFFMQNPESLGFSVSRSVCEATDHC